MIAIAIVIMIVIVAVIAVELAAIITTMMVGGPKIACCVCLLVNCYLKMNYAM